jgi:hypothetical protein
MGAETIIRQKTIRYHHLDDIRVTEIITKVSLLRKSGSPRTEGMRRIVGESGCGINMESNAKRRRLFGYESAEACFSKALEKQRIPRTWMYV